MTHLNDIPEHAPMPPQPAEAPQSATGHGSGGGFAQPPFQPANENWAAPAPSPNEAFEDSASESFSIGAHDKIEDVQAMYAASADAYENVSQAVRASFEEVTAGLTQFNSRLMEFSRINAQRNMAFMENVAGVRSMRDAVDVQTAYLREQYDTAANQLRELQALTTDIAEKASAPFKQQFARSAQIFRSC